MALSIFVNDKVIDAAYTQHRKMQVFIVTEHPKHIIEGIQRKVCRGVTIFHDVGGTYSRTEKTVLMTIIDHCDMFDIYNIVIQPDPYAFMSVSEVDKVYGHFKEQKPV